VEAWTIPLLCILGWESVLVLLLQLAGSVFILTNLVPQAMENFAWNVRVLKGQADLMRQAKLKCLEDIKQVGRFHIK